MFDFRVLQTWADQRPNELAFIDDKHEISFLQLNSLVLRSATFLKELGIEKGMIINIHLPSFLNWVVTLSSHLIGVSSISRKRVLMSEPMLIPDFHLALEADPNVPEERNILFNELVLERIKSTPEYAGSLGFNSPSDIARLIPTSGTTGDSKFVPVLAKDLAPLSELSSSWDFVGDGRALGLFPMGAKQSYRFALKLLANGQTMYRSDFLDHRLAKLLRRNPIHTVFGSPQQVLKMLDSIKHTGSVLPDLKVLAISGSSPTPKLINRIREELGCRVFNVYGSTEVGNAGMTECLDGSLGGININEQVELQVVKESGLSCVTREIGLIRYRSQTMAQNYYKNPQATQEFFKDGFFYPGDIGYLDESGLLFLEGRSQDVINIGGVKYNSDKLDQVVQAQLGVVDCAAFSLQEEDGSEKLALALVVDEDFDLEHFGKVISTKFPLKVNHLFRVESIPRNENGKILRKELSDRYSKKR